MTSRWWTRVTGDLSSSALCYDLYCAGTDVAFVAVSVKKKQNRTLGTFWGGKMHKKPQIRHYTVKHKWGDKIEN